MEVDGWRGLTLLRGAGRASPGLLPPTPVPGLASDLHSLHRLHVPSINHPSTEPRLSPLQRPNQPGQRTESATSEPAGRRTFDLLVAFVSFCFCASPHMSSSHLYEESTYESPYMH